jgi:hypothetical protein
LLQARRVSSWWLGQAQAQMGVMLLLQRASW